MLRFPDRPLNTVQELQTYTTELVQQFGAAAQGVLIRDVVIDVTSTPIAHGQRGTPQAFFVMPQTDARVWRSAPSDPRLIFLQASASVTCDVLVIP